MEKIAKTLNITNPQNHNGQSSYDAETLKNDFNKGSTVLEFELNNILNKRIFFNTKVEDLKRIEIDQFKKLANCVYGKCIQNVRDYMEVYIHTKKDSALKAVGRPTFKNHVILDENLIQTNHSTMSIHHDKPIFAGFAILELVHSFFHKLFSTLKKSFFYLIFYLIFFPEQTNNV